MTLLEYEIPVLTPSTQTAVFQVAASDKPIAKHYIFRHDAPVYGSEVKRLFKGLGYSTDIHYPSVNFMKNPLELNTGLQAIHPTEQELEQFSQNNTSIVFANKTDLDSRIIFEGNVRLPPERKNANRVIQELLESNASPYFFTGPRTPAREFLPDRFWNYSMNLVLILLMKKSK